MLQEQIHGLWTTKSFFITFDRGFFIYNPNIPSFKVPIGSLFGVLVGEFLEQYSIAYLLNNYNTLYNHLT
jgi:hypothetical protein